MVGAYALTNPPVITLAMIRENRSYDELILDQVYHKNGCGRRCSVKVVSR